MCTSSCLPGSQAGLQVGSSIWSLARRSSGHSLCGLPDSLWSGGHSLFGAWHGGHSLWSLPESLWSRGHSLFWSLARWTQPLEQDRNTWSVAAEDLLGLCTAPSTCQMLMILASSALPSVCAVKQVLTLELLCCRCSTCCCCLCNNMFLGCYMATRPRRAFCPHL